MKKVILTERQLELVKLIKEGENYGERIIDKVKTLKGDLNKMYNVLTFTTIAEIRDRDFDLVDTRKKFGVLEATYNTLDNKKDDFEKRNMINVSDWYSKDLEEQYIKMDTRLSTIWKKVDALDAIISGLEAATDLDTNSHFNDISPTEI